MDELTGKQNSHLRSLGQHLEPLLTVGKAGLTEAVAAAVGELLARRELVKLRLPAGPGTQRRALAEELAAAVAAACVGVVGRTTLLYRPNESLADRHRVHLPR
jgi:RNA-binding protein